MRLPAELERLMPTDDEVAFYRELGYYVSAKVLPGTDRHWGGARLAGPRSSGTAAAINVVRSAGSGQRPLPAHGVGFPERSCWDRWLGSGGRLRRLLAVQRRRLRWHRPHTLWRG